MSLTRILIDTSSQVQIQDADYQRLYDNARSIQFAGLLAFYLNSLLTLEPFLLQEKLAFTQKFLAPGISIHTGHGMAFHPAELHHFFPALPTMSLARILIDSSSIQIQDADYQHLYNNARSVQFDEFLAFYLNSLLTLEPFLLQEQLALAQIFLAPGISLHTGYGTAFQPPTIPLPLSLQGDNDVLHTTETPAHNVRPIETTSSNPPQQVDTLGYDLPAEIGSAGSLFDQMSEDCIQTPTQHASMPVPSCYQDRNHDETLSSHIPSAQNVPSIEAGSNTAVADYHTEQVDPYDHGYSSSSIIDATPDLAQMSDPIEQVIDSYQNSQGLDCDPTPEDFTDQDGPSYSSLAASLGVDQSSPTVFTGDCNPSGHVTGECLPADSNLAGAAGMESYPTPVSNPPNTPKPANRVQKRKPRKATRGKAIREDRDVPASSLPALARCNPSPSNETNSPRLDLLRCLVSKACQVTNGETLREPDKMNAGTLRTIHETGDQIIRDTCIVLNDWSEWLLRQFQPVLLPPYHSLSTVEKCVAASRILLEPKGGSHGKSIRRRLAQVLLHIFVPVYAKELEIRENEGETFHRNGRRPMTMAHDFIIGRVGDLNTQDRDRVVNSKNYGKRWWRLGSGIGLITVLTCAPDLVIGDMENRTYTDDFLKLLVNYVRNAYPSAVAHFQSLDPIIQSLFANTSLPTNASVRLDSLHLEFNALPERVQWFNTEKAMEAATDRFLRFFK